MILITAGCNYSWTGSQEASDETPESLPFVDDSTTTSTTLDGIAAPPTTDSTESNDDDSDSGSSAGDNDVDELETPDGQPLQPVTPVGPEETTPTTTGTTAPTTTAGTNNPTNPTPTTASPTTASPTTVTTAAPTTAAPTTAAPTTAAPTTATTAAPTTAAPTTTTPTTTTAAPTTTAAAGPTLVWSDEFTSFNSNRWKKEHSTYGDGNNELQCYTPEQVTVANGRLVLTAEARSETCPNGSLRTVTSGMVRSTGVTFSPGQRIVYRVKLTPNDDANQGGLWPAFWSSGWAGGGWPNGGEWDGFEVMTARSPKRTVFSLHYANSSGNHQKTSKEVFAADNFSDDWHVMSFDYGADGTMIWRMDGVVVQTVSDADTAQGWPAPFDQAMQELKINLALGGNPGPLQPEALPATYEIDYVRIYDLP